MVDRNSYFITTSIAYVNAAPHIGHALEFVQTDAFARYHRLRGDDTYFLTGTDENALTNVQAAEQEGIATQDLVSRNSLRFRQLDKPLDLSFDQFIRTSSDPRHAAGSQKLWSACDRAGDIYKKQYRGLYCVGCEKFYDEDELVGAICPIHERPLEIVEEENYFFRLSRYGERLHELISTDRYRIIPETRKNEVLSFISRGLRDFSISRSESRARNWGVPVPNDASQVIYVWFDALANYITALDYQDDGALYQRYWVNNPHRVHCVGKDIIRFHAVYWPAMLMSAGVPVPETLFVHGFINIGGAKISKSLGNVVDPVGLAGEYGTDALRYYLLRAISPTGDSGFTMENFEARYNADLANDLGNLLNRTVSMVARYRGGTIPEPGAGEQPELDMQKMAEALRERIIGAMGLYDPQTALDAIWEVVSRANKYVEKRAPWILSRAARQGDDAADRLLSTTLFTLFESLRVIAAALDIFLPDTSQRMRAQLGIDVATEGPWLDQMQWRHHITSNTHVSAAEPLFPRLEQPTLTT